mmetsp:Transcript_34100/g.96030  ORF Transcript_34100/g.96030 Transcript_34100/m.96030 type:complete len:218 (-) Transcript_34100:5956-6609(-)
MAQPLPPLVIIRLFPLSLMFLLTRSGSNSIGRVLVFSMRGRSPSLISAGFTAAGGGAALAFPPRFGAGAGTAGTTPAAASACGAAAAASASATTAGAGLSATGTGSGFGLASSRAAAVMAASICFSSVISLLSVVRPVTTAQDRSKLHGMHGRRETASTWKPSVSRIDQAVARTRAPRRELAYRRLSESRITRVRERAFPRVTEYTSVPSTSSAGPA